MIFTFFSSTFSALSMMNIYGLYNLKAKLVTITHYIKQFLAHHRNLKTYCLLFDMLQQESYLSLILKFLAFSTKNLEQSYNFGLILKSDSTFGLPLFSWHRTPKPLGCSELTVA